MKIYTNNTKIGLLIALLTFNTLFACVNTRQELGAGKDNKNWKKSMLVNGLMATAAAARNINANPKNTLSVHNNSNANRNITLRASTNNHTSTIPSTSTGLPYNMTIDNAANILNAIEEEPAKLVRNKRTIGATDDIINPATRFTTIAIPHPRTSDDKELAKLVEEELTECLSNSRIVKNLFFIEHGFALDLKEHGFSLERIRYWLDRGMDRVDPSVGCSLVGTLIEYNIPAASGSIDLLIERGKIDTSFELPYWAIKYTHCPHQQ